MARPRGAVWPVPAGCPNSRRPSCRGPSWAAAPRSTRCSPAGAGDALPIHAVATVLSGVEGAVGATRSIGITVPSRTTRRARRLSPPEVPGGVSASRPRAAARSRSHTARRSACPTPTACSEPAKDSPFRGRRPRAWPAAGFSLRHVRPIPARCRRMVAAT